MAILTVQLKVRKHFEPFKLFLAKLLAVLHNQIDKQQIAQFTVGLKHKNLDKAVNCLEQQLQETLTEYRIKLTATPEEGTLWRFLIFLLYKILKGYIADKILKCERRRYNKI